MIFSLPTSFSIVDIILLLILAGFVFYGLFFGLIKTAGSLIAIIVGFLAASRLYLMLFSLAKPLAFGHDNIGKLVAFALIFTIVDRLVCLGFALLDKAFHVLSIVPFLKTINRLGGAFLGFIEGGLTLGLSLFVISRYLPGGGWLVDQLKDSQLVSFLLKFSNYLTPFLPDILKKIQSVL